MNFLDFFLYGSYRKNSENKNQDHIFANFPFMYLTRKHLIKYLTKGAKKFKNPKLKNTNLRTQNLITQKFKNS